MDWLEVEHEFACPFCAATISMLLDLSVRQQTYIEDCEVCCNPIAITYTVADEMIDSFAAQPAY